MKYTNGFDQFPDLDEEKKEEIDEILNTGAEIDLWDIELPQNIIQKTNKLLEVNDFEVTGVMRDFVTINDEVDEYDKRISIEEKIEYLIRRGNIDNIKQREKDENGNPIGQWKRDIKIAYKAGKLSKEQKRGLEDAGMVWNEGKSKEEKMTLEEKIEYLINRGNIGDIRTDEKDEEGNPIGIWKSQIKTAHKDGKLSEEQQRRSEVAGMVWKEREPQKTLEEKIEYLISRGNIGSISRNLIDEKGNPIGRWKSQIKIAYKAGKLSKEQKRGLEDAGMVWNEGKSKEEKMTLEEKIEYLINRGNIGDIRTDEKDEEGNPIGIWKSRIKTAYKDGKLSEEKKRRLKKAGMVLNEIVPQKTLEEKIEYLISRGNIGSIKQSDKDEEGNPIGRWKNQIKEANKEGKLSEEQQRRLEEAGMLWNERKSKEEQMTLEEKIEYLINRGNIGSISRNTKDEEGNPIGRWKTEIKKANKAGILSEEQKRGLEEAGMVWNEGKSKEERMTLEEKIDYLINRGNIGSISQREKDEEGNPIGRWKNEIKIAHKDGKLSGEQQRRLEESGMVWNEKDKRTSKELAEASISSIKDMELVDAEDVALQQLVEKSKEGGINKDE